jgi:DNA-entry nuclease
MTGALPPGRAPVLFATIMFYVKQFAPQRHLRRQGSRKGTPVQQNLRKSNDVLAENNVEGMPSAEGSRAFGAALSNGDASGTGTASSNGYPEANGMTPSDNQVLTTKAAPNAKQSRTASSSRNPFAHRLAAAFVALLLAFSLTGTGCSGIEITNSGSGSSTTASQTAAHVSSARVTVSDIPEYSGALCIDINDGQPGFTKDDVDRGSFMEFSELDFEGRCGEAFARIGKDTVSNAERGDISQIHPSGWVQHRYDFVDQNMVYNRSHLIAHQLSGENANERNLITGTRTMNSVGMTYYEEIVGDYVRQTGNHVLYRVTPIFAANDLVARGVQMEAESIEDGGKAIRFNVFIYNVEPGVEINYVTGDNWESSKTVATTSEGEVTKTTAKTKDEALEKTAAELAAEEGSTASGNANGTSNASGSNSSSNSNSTSASSSSSSEASDSANSSASTSTGNASDQQEYVLNTKNKKFHKPSCSGADSISSDNRKTFTGSRETLIDRGYAPCGQCNP